MPGNLTFLDTADRTLRASSVMVRNSGILRVGAPGAGFSNSAAIVLSGTRESPEWAIDDSFSLGAKVLGAFEGGSIGLWGRPTAQRWTELGAPAAAGATSITLRGAVDWRVNDTVLLTSTTWNPWNLDTATIAAIDPTGTMLTLAAPLQFAHGCAAAAAPAQGLALALCAQVALISSNVVVSAADGAAQHASVHGES